jgi:hypothetical protein
MSVGCPQRFVQDCSTMQKASSVGFFKIHFPTFRTSRVTLSSLGLSTVHLQILQEFFFQILLEFESLCEEKESRKPR